MAIDKRVLRDLAIIKKQVMADEFNDNELKGGEEMPRRLSEDENETAPIDESDYLGEPNEQAQVNPARKPINTPSMPKRPEIAKTKQEVKVRVEEREINLSLINAKLNWIVGALSEIRDKLDLSGELE